ncbi:hypothetical protein H4R19_005953, partial [Coemansia spiralis]
MLVRISGVRRAAAAGARLFSAGRQASGSAVRAAVILQRDPIVLQQSKGFEVAADRYFGWLEYMSAEKFPREFFFKKGSTAEKKWTELEAGRVTEWHLDPASRPAAAPARKGAKAAASNDEAAGAGEEVPSSLSVSSSASEQRI